MNKNYIVYLHWCGISHKELHGIVALGKDFEEVYKNLSCETLRIYIPSQKRRDDIVKRYQTIDTNKLDAIIQKVGVTITLYTDSDYPEGLKNISHPPFIIYVRGKIPKSEMFAVVGARKITSYGKRVISHIVPEISKVFAIVSGGAAGCDTEAHKACLEHETLTCVVMGTGIDQCYPVMNSKMFDQVVDSGGAVISTFRLEEPGNPYNFPVRNEIVVGLSRGVLVVEAEERSGSLITAGLALEYGKDLFSIPGDIFSKSSGGANALIQKGEAKSVVSSFDILEEYNIEVKKSLHKDITESLSDEERIIYDILSLGVLDVDTIVLHSPLGAQVTLGMLSLLEIKGCIKKDLSGKYIFS